MNPDIAHVPVLLSETLTTVALQPGDNCIDCTIGGAGHAEAMLMATSPTGQLLGLDADSAAVRRAETRLAKFGQRVILRQANFGEVGTVAQAVRFPMAQGALVDLGLSSHQLGEGERGFSFLLAGPLDMRMNQGAPLTAAEIVNEWSQDDLASVIYRYGEEPRSRRIARAIVAARPIDRTTELAEIVSRALGGRRGDRMHPATRTFQALRIAVNDELGVLERALPQLVELLAPGGRLAVITFHSLEDRIVKHFIQRETRDCICDVEPGLYRAAGELVCRCGHKATLRPITRKPVLPSEDEQKRNPRSRSAKLRVAERIAVQ